MDLSRLAAELGARESGIRVAIWPLLLNARASCLQIQNRPEVDEELAKIEELANADAEPIFLREEMVLERLQNQINDAIGAMEEPPEAAISFKRMRARLAGERASGSRESSRRSSLKHAPPSSCRSRRVLPPDMRSSSSEPSVHIVARQSLRSRCRRVAARSASVHCDGTITEHARGARAAVRPDRPRHESGRARNRRRDSGETRRASSRCRPGVGRLDIPGGGLRARAGAMRRAVVGEARTP